MHTQLINDFLNLKGVHRVRIQRELNITFHQGDHESLRDYAKRILTECDKEGKIRQLEALITEVA